MLLQIFLENCFKSSKCKIVFSSMNEGCIKDMWSIRQKIKHVELKFRKTWKKIKTNPGLEEGSSTHTHIYTHTNTHTHKHRHTHFFICIRAPTECCPLSVKANLIKFFHDDIISSTYMLTSCILTAFRHMGKTKL